MRLGALRGLVPLAVLLGIWQLVGDPSSPTTPAPSRWWSALKSVEASGVLWSALGKTLEIFAEGLVIATAIGVALGVALGASRRLSQALGPLLEFFRTTPAAALVPGALILFGARGRTDVGIVVYGCVWPILLNVAASRGALPPLRLDVAHSLRLSWWERMRKIVLPSLVPAIVVGVRVAAPICFIVTLLVDFLLSTGGLGFQLVNYQQAFDAAGAFALLAFIGVVGCLISVVIGGAERLALRRWPHAGPR
ncbi:MAG TPA: ABC transporter permease subunit [Solirubrobacteraceae bacterium]|jgi:ABC-type nitrate/sulfonate/bicarbonate transport system permease component|nr:ABC transporter permease subunit [Solirubrobacteraceae bacterium]